MKLLKKEIKQNYKSFIIWMLAASLLAFFAMSVFSSVVEEAAEQFKELTKNFPKEFLDAFQITNESFTNPLYFYAVKGYLYVILIMSIYSSMLGLKLLNKEESEKTIEFILTKPISRFRYVTEKFLSLIFFVVAINLITNIALYLGFLVGVKTDYSVISLINLSIGGLLITIFFGTLSFMIASISKRNRGLSGFSIGIVMLSFILGILSNISDSLEFLKYFSIFEYFNANDILDNGLAFSSILIAIIFTSIFIVTSYKVYLKKDIYI